MCFRGRHTPSALLWHSRGVMGCICLLRVFHPLHLWNRSLTRAVCVRQCEVDLQSHSSVRRPSRTPRPHLLSFCWGRDLLDITCLLSPDTGPWQPRTVAHPEPWPQGQTPWDLRDRSKSWREHEPYSILPSRLVGSTSGLWNPRVLSKCYMILFSIKIDKDPKGDGQYRKTRIKKMIVQR